MTGFMSKIDENEVCQSKLTFDLVKDELNCRRSIFQFFKNLTLLEIYRHIFLKKGSSFFIFFHQKWLSFEFETVVASVSKYNKGWNDSWLHQNNLNHILRQKNNLAFNNHLWRIQKMLTILVSIMENSFFVFNCDYCCFNNSLPSTHLNIWIFSYIYFFMTRQILSFYRYKKNRFFSLVHEKLLCSVLNIIILNKPEVYSHSITIQGRTGGFWKAYM